MKTIHSLLEKGKFGISLFLVFITPLYFFPRFQSIVQINVMYVLAFGALILLVISISQFLISKKFIFHKNTLDLPIIIFIIAVSISLFTSATNKIQAFLDPNFGLLMILSLAILYYYLSRFQVKIKNNLFSSTLALSGFIVSILIVVLSLEPTKGVGAISLQLLIFIGFTVMLSLGSLIHSFSSSGETPKVAQICMLIVVSLALIITVVGISKQGPLFHSFSLSFAAFSQIFKNPFTFFFGFGIDNFSPIFNRVKDVTFNQTDLWKLSILTDRSTILHIATTTGMAGLISFVYILISMIKKIKQNSPLMLAFIYAVCVLVFLPPSLLIMFLLFFFSSQTGEQKKEPSLHFSATFSLYSYLILIITVCVVLGGVLYYLGAFFLASYFSTQAYLNYQANDLKSAYTNQQKALTYNPYIEQYHDDLIGSYMIITENITNLAASASASVAGQPVAADKLVLSKERKDVLMQTLQSAIDEAQFTISLNPNRADSWAQLARVYAIIPKELQDPNQKEQDSPQTATLTYYKKAQELDKNNPLYPFQIGQIYVAQKKINEGLTSVKKSIALKSDWADSHFILGTIYAQKQDMTNAQKELELALANLDEKTQQKEYNTVKQVLDAMKTSQQQSGANNAPAPTQQVQSPFVPAPIRSPMK